MVYCILLTLMNSIEDLDNNVLGDCTHLWQLFVWNRKRSGSLNWVSNERREEEEKKGMKKSEERLFIADKAPLPLHSCHASSEHWKGTSVP